MLASLLQLGFAGRIDGQICLFFDRLDTPADSELSQPARIPSHLRPNCLRWPGSFLDMTFRFRRSAIAQPAAALNCAVLALAALAAEARTVRHRDISGVLRAN